MIPVDSHSTNGLIPNIGSRAAKKVPARTLPRNIPPAKTASGTPPPTPPPHSTPYNTPPGTPGSEAAAGKKISAWTLMETLYKYKAQKAEQLSHDKVTRALLSPSSYHCHVLWLMIPLRHYIDMNK
jgi:hypothetical protein